MTELLQRVKLITWRVNSNKMRYMRCKVTCPDSVSIFSDISDTEVVGSAYNFVSTGNGLFCDLFFFKEVSEKTIAPAFIVDKIVERKGVEVIEGAKLTGLYLGTVHSFPKLSNNLEKARNPRRAKKVV